MEPRAPLYSLSEAWRLKEWVSVVVRKIRFLDVILQHSPVLVLAIGEVCEAEQDQQEFLHCKQLHCKHLPHLGLLRPAKDRVVGGI